MNLVTPPATHSPNATAASPALAELVEQYKRDGYVIVRQCFSPEEVEELATLFHDMHASGGVPGHYEPGKLKYDTPLPGHVKDPLVEWPRVMQPHRFNQRAREFLLHPKVIKYVSAFAEGEPVGTQSMFYFKPPGSRGQAMHQDNFYLLVQPGSCLAAWTAIDDSNAENGGLMVVPNTHNTRLICPGPADPLESYANQKIPLTKEFARPVYAEMKAGDTLFFNGNVIHGSGPNRSKTRFRRSWICHYARGDLDRISRFYTPVVKMDGSDYTPNFDASGGPCGNAWEGAAH